MVVLSPGHWAAEACGRREHVHRTAEVSDLLLRHVRALLIATAYCPAAGRHCSARWQIGMFAKYAQVSPFLQFLSV